MTSKIDDVVWVHVSLRLSARQVSLIRPGIGKLVSAQKQYISTKKLPNSSYPFSMYPLKDPKRRGKHDQYMMKQIEEAWMCLQSRSSHGIRLTLTTFQVRAYILALRVEQDFCRAGARFLTKRNKLRNLSPEKTKAELKRRWAETKSREQLKRDSERVIHSLEKHLKRADYRMKSALGDDSFKLLVGIWQQHVQWVRMHLVYFRPWPRTIVLSPKLRRDFIDLMVQAATEGIEYSGCIPPSKKRLRQLIRRRLRYQRRGDCSILNWNSSMSTMRSILSSFVFARVNCRSRREDS